MKSLFLFVGASAVVFLAGGCGSQPEGTWKTACTGQQIAILKITGEKATIEKTNYFDSLCKDQRALVRQTAKVVETSSNKSGVLDSLVFTFNSDADFAFYSSDELVAQNKALTLAKKAKEQDITGDESESDRRSKTLDNDKLSEVKKVTKFTLGEAKTLSWMQAESLGLKALAPINSLVNTAKFQTDNNVLILDLGANRSSSSYNDSKESIMSRLVFFK